MNKMLLIIKLTKLKLTRLKIGLEIYCWQDFTFFQHQDNMSMLFIKTGVYRGIHYFLIFALKHRLWVLLRTASCEAVLTCTHNVLSKNKKNITFFHLKIIFFYSRETHGLVFVMKRHN